MKFCEAMELLKAGCTVTRERWKGSIYFVLQGNDVKSFRPALTNYVYNEDIMISDGWLVEEDDKQHSFCDIISLLYQGKKAKLADWKDAYIYLDRETKQLVLYSMEMFPFVPEFEAFNADDWIEV